MMVNHKDRFSRDAVGQNILNETSNAKYLRSIILFKKEVLLELLYRSEIMADKIG